MTPEQLAKLRQSSAAAIAKFQATYAAAQKPAQTPVSSGVSSQDTTKTTGSTPNLPAYGSNVANFDPNNPTHVALADAGQEYARAKAARDTAGMAAAAAKGQEIRNNSGTDTSYDSQKGITTFKPAFNGIIATPSSSGGSSMPGNETAKQYIDELADARRSAQIAALGKSRDAALSNLGAEKSTIKPMYTDAKNQAASGSQQAARNFAEYMAARGGTHSGSAAQAELSRQGALQGSLGALGRQETAALGDIERRSSDVKNAYASDVAASEAGIQSEQMNLLLQDLYRAQARNDQLRQQEIENELARAGLTGYIGSTGGQQRTLAGQQFDANQTQQQYENQFQQDQFDYQKYVDQRNFNQAQYESDRNYRYSVQQDAIKNGQWEKQFQQDVQRVGFDQASELWRQAFQENQQTQDDAFRKAQLEQQLNQDDRAAAAQAQDAIMSSNLVTTTKDPITNTQTLGVPDPDALNRYIKSLNLSDNATDSLLYQFGLDQYVK